MKFKKNQKGNSIKIIPLGGVEEIGINSTAIEYKGEIIVVDMGMGFPENDQYGIDYLIPNPYFLGKNKKRIKAIFITHAHYDHIGALDIILPRLNFPKVYAPRFATELIKSRFKESKILNKVQIITYNEEDKFKFKNFQIEFFHVNHSTPDSFGIALHTDLGTIIHTGDFKFDNSPVGEKPANLKKIARLGANGVLALLSDSTNSFKNGFSKSESEISDILKDVVESAKGRIIVATFSQLVLRINQLLIVAESLNKKVAISGRSLETSIKIAKKIGYIKVSNDLFVNLHSIKNYPKNQQMILTTGHQGETMAALSRIARGEHKDIKIEKGDTVILSSSVIPGNEVLVQRMIDDLYKQGATVFHQAIMDLHAGGHGYKEDQKMMLNLTRPKFFIPVHGYQSFLGEHAKTANTLGIPEANTIIAKNGQEILITKESIKIGKRYKAFPLIVSGLGVGDIGQSVLSDREQLANFGVVIIDCIIDQKRRKIINELEVITRGFVYEKSLGKLISEIKDVANKEINSYVRSDLKSKEISEKVEKKLMKFIYKKIQREPMIFVLVRFV